MIEIKNGLCTKCGMSLEDHAYSYTGWDDLRYTVVKTAFLCPHKLCIQCGKMQPLFLFSRYTGTPHHTCKDCVRARYDNKKRVEKLLQDDPSLRIIY